MFLRRATEVVRRCSLSADDIWLKTVEVSKGIPVVWAECKRQMPLEIPRLRHGPRLCDVNVTGGENDRAMNRSMEHFGLTAADFGVSEFVALTAETECDS